MYRRPNHKFKFITIVLCSAASYFVYSVYQHQIKLQNQLSSLHEAYIARSVESIKHKPVVVAAGEHTNWIDVQKNVKDAVVQVFSQSSHFNWIEPYKTPSQSEGAGSGFFINENGDLLTNYHVIEEARSVEIQVPSLGKQRLDVHVVGVSPDRDIALLRLDEASRDIIKSVLGEIPYIKFGSSDSIIRTQELLALGYPLGQQSLKSTQGVVSGRELLGGKSYIQMTAPINPGNSGGPAINTEGEVVGINAAGVPGAQNVGYVIPISEVKSAINDLYKVKLLRRPTLGGVFIPSTETSVSYLGNPAGGGWYVARVFKNSLLEKVGIQENDMIYEINGHGIDKYGEVSVGWAEEKVSVLALLNRYVVGDDIHLVAYRNGTRKDFRFKLELSDIMPIRRIFPEFEKIDYEVFGGMVVMQLTLNHVASMIKAPHLMKFSRLKYQDKPKLIITNILPNSHAYKTRCLFAPSIIDEVNGVKATTLAEFRNAILKGKSTGYLTIKAEDVASDGIFVALPLEKVLNQEEDLSNRFFYKESSLVSQLRDGMHA